MAVTLAAGLDGGSVQEVLQEAQRRGFTRQGEMFSLDQEAELARSFTDRPVSVEMSSIMLNTEYVSHYKLFSSQVIIIKHGT